MMNNKKWIKEIIAHSVTGPVPWNMTFSPPAIEALQKYYGEENILEKWLFQKKVMMWFWRYTLANYYK